MPDRKQLLIDFYSKYAPEQELTDERLSAIDKKYGDDNKRLLSDFYAKYAPEQELSEERFQAIENKYGLKKKVQSESGETSFAQPFMATPSTGEPTLSTVSRSPLKKQKSISPSESIGIGKPIDVNASLAKSLRQQAQASEDFGVAPAMAAEEVKLEGDRRKKFLGETSANIYSTVIEPNIDLFVSQKDKPAMYGTQKIPAGTVNTDAIYEAVDAYDDKYFKTTGERLDKEARQAIAVNLVDQIKTGEKRFKAAALIDIDLKKQNLPTLNQLNIEAQDKVKKVKSLVEERNNFVEKARKNPDKEVLKEATTETDILKADYKANIANLDKESEAYIENLYKQQVDPIRSHYQELVDTRQMLPDQANAEFKAAAAQVEEKVKQDTALKFTSMYEQLNKAAKDKTIEVQTKYNRKFQEKYKAQLDIYQKRIDAAIGEADNISPEYKKAVEEASKKAYGFLFKEEENQKLADFRNLSIGMKVGKAWEAGLTDVLSTVGGAINMTGFDASGINELALKAEQLTGVPSSAWSDKDVMDAFTDVDWWITNGVRSMPFTVFTMPIGLGAGRLAGTLAGAFNATKRAQMLSSVVGGGLIGWEAEAMLEAGGTWNDAVDRGASREEAAKIAKDSMDLQLSTLPMNILQMLPFFSKGFKFAKSAFIEGASGYLEEVQQGWAGQRAKNLAEGVEQRGFGEAVNSFGDYFFSKEALQEGTIGAAVGQTMTLASLNNTPDIDLQINGIMSSLSVGGESQARKMLEIMAKNGAISEAELNEYNNLIDYTLEGIAQTESFPVSDSIRASLVNKYVGLFKARALANDDDNSLATQAAKELVQEKEKEIKDILKGTEPVYLLFPKGSDIPIVSTKEQVEQMLKRPEYLNEFDVEIYNDQNTQAKLDEVTAALEKLSRPQEEVAVEEAPALETPAVKGQKTENELKVEELRAQEQAELAEAIPNIEEYKVDGKVDESLITDPADLKAYKEIYGRYDKLITPLLEGTEAEQVAPVETEQVEAPKAEVKSNKIENYNGIFSVKTTGIPNLDELLKDDGYNYFYKGVSGEIVMMSPEEYLKKVRQDITKTDRDEGIYNEKKERINEGIDRGDKINMPYLSIDENGKAHSQEGRNRATIAIERGEKLIPVFIERDISFDDKINKGKEYVELAIKNGAKSKEDVLNSLKESGLHRDAIRFIDENFNEKAVEDLLGTKEQAPVEAKPAKEMPANVTEIAEKVGEPANKVQNVYNKYGDKTKDISEITEEDYEKAKANREKSKKAIRQKAIEAKLKQQELTKLEAKTEQKKLDKLKEQDAKEVKKVDDFMELLPDLQKALLKTGDITTDCKWGK
jgi:hypothetical protein